MVFYFDFMSNLNPPPSIMYSNVQCFFLPDVWSRSYLNLEIFP